MALQTSGPISLANIQTEFGGSNPISLSEYYGAAAGIPASGAIGLSNFYGATASKIDYIIIPASETGLLFTGDAKFHGTDFYFNLGVTCFVTSTAYPLQYGTMYTKYSRFAEELGYSSILLEIEPSYSSIDGSLSKSTSALIHLTNLPPNTAVSSGTLGPMGGEYATAFTTPYKLAGRELIKQIKVTRAGLTTTLDVCQWDSKPANTQWGVNEADPYFTPIELSYQAGTLVLPWGYDSTQDFPIGHAPGKQQYSVEIEWL